MTKQQLLVLDIVEHCDGHISAEEVFDRAREKMPGISFGTVYRNLGKLCEAGTIREVPVTKGAARYERMQIAHGHLVCVKCQRIVDFPIVDIDMLEQKLKTKILSYSCCVTHIGDSCKNKINN